MPQNPRAAQKQARIIRARLERLARPGGPLADADVRPSDLSTDDLIEIIDTDDPWPVNLRTVALDMVPDLDRGDVEGLR